MINSIDQTTRDSRELRLLPRAVEELGPEWYPPKKSEAITKGLGQRTEEYKLTGAEATTGREPELSMVVVEQWG